MFSTDGLLLSALIEEREQREDHSRENNLPRAILIARSKLCHLQISSSQRFNFQIICRVFPDIFRAALITVT
jgi:hypothetical protein